MKNRVSNPVVSITVRNEEDPLAGLFRDLLLALGEDPVREGLQRTPVRMARSLRMLTSGYNQNVDQVLNGALFAENYDEMVTVKDISFYSLCEHHLLPFFGRCHVGYVPKDRIVGLSKIARMVEIFAKRLQVQERFTKQIAETIQKALDPKGVAVVVEAEHLCMQMRGVQKPGSKVVTSSMLGVFRRRQETREEFMNLIRG
ncbi:MAG: GTP cyclohydrolase I FolE [Deltaproteobacteria bacterium]|nr:GTP cyclohydrolase I FolE [Deltaproteobacteria bacterium]MBI2500972.1 GTP cyclohydrolase I FolE [Deltaproteobacteria bacterium]MBI4196376.1 GTP cyclohydrolase I FolE [Deltaproteobacteria bacterium]